MTKILKKLHRYTAYATAIFITILCLSGAILLFAQSWDKYLYPEHWRASVSSERASMDDMVALAEKHSGAQVTYFNLGKADDDVWQFRLTNKKLINIDPYRLTVTKYYYYHEHIYGFTMLLHRWLLWESADGNKPLQDWVSIVSLSLLFNLLVGIYLWIKPKSPLKRLRIRWTGNIKILFSQLHNVMGVIAIIPLMLIVFSGIAFNWQQPVKFILESVTLQEIESRPNVKYTSVDDRFTHPIAPIVARGMLKLPQGKLFRVYLPRGNNPLRLRVKMPKETHAYSWVWIDPHSGDVIEYYNGEQVNLVTKIWLFKYKFHIGQFIHPSVEWVWLFFCLVPIILLVTGLTTVVLRTFAKPVRIRKKL